MTTTDRSNSPVESNSEDAQGLLSNLIELAALADSDAAAASPAEVNLSPSPSLIPIRLGQRRGTLVTSNVRNSNNSDAAAPQDDSSPPVVGGLRRDDSTLDTADSTKFDSSGSGGGSFTLSSLEKNGTSGRRVSYADESNASTETASKATKKSRTSRRSGSGISMNGIWNDFTRRNSVWETESLLSADDYDDHISFKECFVTRLESTGRWLRSTLKTAFMKPSILIPSLLLFVVLVVCGIFIVYGFDRAEAESRKQEAVFVAEQTDMFFVSILENAFSPLFTMSMFVQELPEFHELDLKVGDRCYAPLNCSESTSAPPKPGNETTHRDLSKLFNTTYGQTIQRKFDTIASGIKENNGLGKALVTIQLAPKGVVSLIYPMVNCDDFKDNPQVEKGYCMNNTAAWGHDLLNDPARVAIARETVPADDVVTAGPLKLIQGRDTFIARLRINMDIEEGGERHAMVVDNKTYPCWGFAVVLLDWSTLKEQSNIYNDFKSKKMQFKLSRTDVKDGEEVVVSIAESANSSLCARENVTRDLDTGDNGWVIAVCYDEGFSPNYKVWAYPIVFIVSFICTILIMLVLVSKSQVESILLRLMPPRAIRKLRKGETIVDNFDMVTIFFSDVVGYTEMSSEMTPVEVMKLLNNLYSKFDIEADKHGVFKVETIGDAYIAVAGCPKKCSGPEAAQKMALFALDAMKIVNDFKTDGGAQVYIRAGLASGPCVAGVIGKALPKYTLFGDTVNFAARMEQTSEKMRIQISPTTQRMLLDAPAYEFECEERRDDSDELGVEVKGKGRQYTYWVNSAKKLPASSKSNGIAKSQWTFSKRSGYEEESLKLSEGNANQACLRIGEETTREGNLLPRTFQEALPLQSKSGIAEIRAIVVTDVKPPFAVVGVNKPWEDLCGYKDAEAAGLPLSTLIQGPKTDLKGFQQAMGDLISGADCVECYTVHYRKDGSMFSNFLQMGPLYAKNDGGDVEKGDRKASYFVGVFNNVGELDRSAQEEDREENST